MSLTLAEAERFSTNMVYRGVVEEFLRATPIFRLLPFEEVVGNALQYLRESTRSTVAFRDPEETWTESSSVTTQVTATLKILGGDVDIDNFLKQTRSNYTDVEATKVNEKVKSMKFGFLDSFYYGNTTTNAKEFSGMNALIAAADRTNQGSGATGAALSFINLDTAIDSVEGNPPDLLVTTKAIRRRINSYTRANNSYITDKDKWGDTIAYYNGIPLYVDDSLVMTETIASGDYSAKTGGATGALWVVRFGSDGVSGIQNGASIEVEKIGQLESKDAMRWRVRWYCGLLLYSTTGLGVVDGITDAAATS